MAWVAPVLRPAALKWPFNRHQTIALALIIGILSGITLLMIFPVLPANSPAGIIYLFHDQIVLPIRGRVFERYAPVPQIVLLTLLALGVISIIARKQAGRIYDITLNLLLRFEITRNLLRWWIEQRPVDAPLRSGIEAQFRRMSDAAFLNRTEADVQIARHLGTFLLRLPWTSATRPDIARSLIAARQLSLGLMVNRDQNQASLVADALIDPGPLSAQLGSLLRAGATSDDRRDAVETAWDITGSFEPPDDDLAREAVLWFAVVFGLLEDDATLSRSIQQRIAALAFNRDLSGHAAFGSTLMLFDPAVWSLDPGLPRGDAIPGMALSGEAVSHLSQGVDAAHEAGE